MNDDYDNAHDDKAALKKYASSAPPIKALIPLEIRSNNFYAKWLVTPEKLTEFLAFACTCILEADKEAKAQNELTKD